MAIAGGQTTQWNRRGAVTELECLRAMAEQAGRVIEIEKQLKDVGVIDNPQLYGVLRSDLLAYRGFLESLHRLWVRQFANGPRAA